MQPVSIASVLLATTVAALSPLAAAAEKLDFGKREYQSNCAVCHGESGKGDGPYKPYLTRSPSDLTVIARQNGGVFPMDRVCRIIDGRDVVGAHGTRDMPIWGHVYLTKAVGDYMDAPYDVEIYARGRVIALAEYVSRLQVK